MSENTQRIVTSHKEAAKRATEFLEGARKLKLTAAESLELVARVLGVANWQTLHAMAKQGKAPRTPVVAVSGANTVEARAERLAQIYCVEANGWRQEHPEHTKEVWESSTSQDDVSVVGYWLWVVGRLDETKAMMPWGRDVHPDVLLARAGGVDVDFDFDSELWLVASTESDEFFSLPGRTDEAQAWHQACTAMSAYVANALGISEKTWTSMTLSAKLESAHKVFPRIAPVAPAVKFIPVELLKRAVTREDLIANGFVPTAYKGQPGEFLVKKQLARAMLYVLEHIVDGEELLAESQIIVEVTPENMVQMSVVDGDYFEEPVDVESDEGRALLKDAGFIFPA